MPKKALTAASVARIRPPPKGQIDYFDQGYPGLALRVSYGGTKSFVFFYRLGGKLRRLTLGSFRPLDPGDKEPEPKLGNPITLKGARDLWRTARQDVQAGRDPSRARPTGIGATDVKGVVEEWLKRDQAKNKRVRVVERIMERDIIPAWGHRQIADIKRRDVLDVIDAVVDRGAPIMARRVHGHLHRLFKWAVGRGIVDVNPLADLPKPGSETKRDRVLTDEELVKVWNACDALPWHFGNATRLLILTGARRDEIGHLQWSEIDNGEISLSGKRTKNGEVHIIPLSAPAKDLIENLKRSDSPYVFVAGRKPITGWPPVKKALDELAKIAPWRIHDLRRTVATGLQKLQTPLQVTEAVLGHTAGSRAGVVGLYQRHDYADEKRAALEAWGKHVAALANGARRT